MPAHILIPLNAHLCFQNPVDPSKSDGRYSRSFLSVFEACVELISIVRQSVIYHPALIGR